MPKRLKRIYNRAPATCGDESFRTYLLLCPPWSQAVPLFGGPCVPVNPANTCPIQLDPIGGCIWIGSAISGGEVLNAQLELFHFPIDYYQLGMTSSAAGQSTWQKVTGPDASGTYATLELCTLPTAMEIVIAS